jgi:hypothetical protein
MHHKAIPIPSGLDAASAYEMLLRNRCAYYAAQVARDYELGADKMLSAAFTAYRHFDRFGFEDAARKVAEEFGLTAEMILSMYANFSDDVTVVRKNVLDLPPIDPPREGGSAAN